MGSQRVRQGWATLLSLFTFMHWRRQWQPAPVFLPGESQGRGSLVGCRLWGHTESDTTEVTQQQQQQHTHIYIWVNTFGFYKLHSLAYFCFSSRGRHMHRKYLFIPTYTYELFQILKDDTVKVLHSVCQQIWKTQQWPQDWKRSVFIPIPKKGNTKECSNYLTVALISHASKVMLKILQARLSNMWTVNFLMFKLVLEKAEEPEIKLPTSAGPWKKRESSRKTSISALLTMPKPLTVWITINSGKFWKRSESQTTWPASWETCMQVRKQLELDMEQQTGSK